MLPAKEPGEVLPRFRGFFSSDRFVRELNRAQLPPRMNLVIPKPLPSWAICSLKQLFDQSGGGILGGSAALSVRSF